MMVSSMRLTAAFAVGTSLLIACVPGPPPEERGVEGVEEDVTAYRAVLEPLNPGALASPATGTAILSIEGDTLSIEVQAENVPPNMMHLQHYHGFIDGRQAVCPDEEADVNEDGLVDLLETESVSGITLVPFHDDPASLTIQSNAYPVADADGNYTYRQRVDLTQLLRELAAQKGVDELSLDDRVVYIHGVPEDTELPETVQSLPDVPAHVTLPIACGRLELVQTEATEL